MTTLLNDLRQRVLAGETVQPKEYHLVVENLRRDRQAAQNKAPAKTKRAAKPKVTADGKTTDQLLDMFDQPVKE